MIDPESHTITLPLAFLGQLSEAESVEAVLSTAARWLPELVPAVRSSCAFLLGQRVVGTTHWCDNRSEPSGFQDAALTGGLTLQELADCRGHRSLNAAALAVSEKRAYRRLYADGIRSLLLVPMLGGDRTVGLLTVARDATTGFTKSDGKILKVVGQCVAAQVMLMQQIRTTARLAETDPLTGLANRARLMRVLRQGGDDLHRPDAAGRHVGLMHIDLDHFKAVNDSLGHGVGDGLLRFVAQIMKSVAGPKDLVARIGGDEFVIVTRSDPMGHAIADLGERLVEALSRPIRIGHSEVQIGASIGTAIARDADCNGERLIAHADLALYEVKRNGRGGVHAFDSGMRQASAKRTRLLSDLRQARAERAFLPYFQPLVSMETGLFSGFEMLARWDHPEFGLLDPTDFLDLVAEVGLSHDVDRIVRLKGLAALYALRRDGWTAPRMSFNASARTLADRSLAKTLAREVAKFRLSPGDLAIEVREPDLRQLGKSLVHEAISALAEAGFAVELDDFGSGLACMTTLVHAPIRAIKMDAALTGLLPDARAEKVMRAAITLTQELGMEAIAEGVETPEQFARLRKMGCHHAQGYGISRPLPLEELIRFMEGYGKAPVALAIQDKTA